MEPFSRSVYDCIGYTVVILMVFLYLGIICTYGEPALIHAIHFFKIHLTYAGNQITTFIAFLIRFYNDAWNHINGLGGKIDLSLFDIAGIISLAGAWIGGWKGLFVGSKIKELKETINDLKSKLEDLDNEYQSLERKLEERYPEIEIYDDEPDFEY